MALFLPTLNISRLNFRYPNLIKLGDSCTTINYQWTSAVRFSIDSTTTEKEEVEKMSQRKILRMALLGRPNAGKSTLINRIVNMNLCDVSRKTHTTRFLLRTAATHGDTQIVFVDTPGLVTKKEMRRFKLEREFSSWRGKIHEEIDIVGFICDAEGIVSSRNFHQNLTQNLREIPESLPVCLILNKIDLIKDKPKLIEVVNRLTKSSTSDETTSIESNTSEENSTKKNRRQFSEIFFISALQNIGVDDLLRYLLRMAKPGEWMFKHPEICDTPLHTLIPNLLRAKMLNKLGNEIPYNCTYEVEYMEENNLGELVCLALITCGKRRYKGIILQRKNRLRTLAQELESDLHQITGKSVRLRIVINNESVKTKEASGAMSGFWAATEENPSSLRQHQPVTPCGS